MERLKGQQLWWSVHGVRCIVVFRPLSNDKAVATFSPALECSCIALLVLTPPIHSAPTRVILRQISGLEDGQGSVGGGVRAAPARCRRRPDLSRSVLPRE
jgi:hypothetical protein